jgi:hypothetical protein
MASPPDMAEPWRQLQARFIRERGHHTEDHCLEKKTCENKFVLYRVR